MLITKTKLIDQLWQKIGKITSVPSRVEHVNKVHELVTLVGRVTFINDQEVKLDFIAGTDIKDAGGIMYYLTTWKYKVYSNFNGVAIEMEDKSQ